MYTFFSALNYLSYYCKSYLFGFALVYIILFLFKNFILKTAFKTIPYIGLIFFICTSISYGVEFILAYYSGVSYTQYISLNPILNNIWVAIIFPLLFVFIPTQLFWFEKIRNLKWIVLGLTYFFIFSFERTYIFLSAFHRDYLPSTWTMYAGDLLIEILTSVILFLLITLIFHYKNGIFSRVKTLLNI